MWNYLSFHDNGKVDDQCHFQFDILSDLGVDMYYIPWLSNFGKVKVTDCMTESVFGEFRETRTKGSLQAWLHVAMEIGVLNDWPREIAAKLVFSSIGFIELVLFKVLSQFCVLVVARVPATCWLFGLCGTKDVSNDLLIISPVVMPHSSDTWFSFF